MATQRLPTPGSDNGTWGSILNGFLEVSHNADGTLSPSAVTAAGAATLASPSFTGTPTAPTASPGTNTTQLATTAFTTTALGALSGEYVPTTTGVTRRGGTSTPAATLPYFNVLDYGATGNGSTDDTAAIQATINATPTGGSVYFPGGYNFYCASSLTIPNYLTLSGDGYGSQLSTGTNGNWISWTGANRIKFVALRFILNGNSTTGTLFNLNDCFRISWHRCYMSGNYTGPAGSGSYLGTTGINFNNNTGNCYLIETEIDNFGIGISTSAIQNWWDGGQCGSNNVGIYGSGDGGMSIDNVVFVSAAVNPPTTTHIQIDGAIGEWWISNTWFEGCGTGVSVGNGSGGPQQFGMSNCKIAATNSVLVFNTATSIMLFNVMLSGDDANVATPTPVTLNSTNCPSGFVFGLFSNMTAQVSTSTFPQNWTVAVREGGGTGYLKAPTYFQMTRSDGTPINILTTSGGPTLNITGPGTNVQGVVTFKDTGGSTLAQIDSVPGVNYPGLVGSTTGNPVELVARGTDTNIGLNLVTKGSGVVTVNGSAIGGASGWVAEPITYTSPTVSTATGTSAITSIAINASPIAASSGDTFYLTNNAGNTQTVTLSAALAVGATSMSISSLTPSVSYLSGSELVPHSITYTVPAAVTQIIVRMLSAGGGGGGSAGSSPTVNGNPGAGGGAGQYIEQIVPVTATNTAKITLGQAGAGGTAGTINQGTAGGAGNYGGNTIFNYNSSAVVITGGNSAGGAGGAMGAAAQARAGGYGINITTTYTGLPGSGGLSGNANTGNSAYPGFGFVATGGGGGGASTGTTNGNAGLSGNIPGQIGGTGGTLNGGTPTSANAPLNSGAGGGGAGGTGTVVSTGAVGSAGSYGGSGWLEIQPIG